jgi:neutral amino acid transport system ATP-binding protein
VSLLEARALRGGYGPVDIVADVDLDVAEREIVVIAGTNGSGKSTLVRAVMGLLPRTSGSLRLAGRELAGVPAERRLALGMAYVPQVANVFPSLTVSENLDVVEGVSDRARRTEEVLERFPALRQRLRQSAGSLSGGERQQLAFARALLPRPRLMILDEPTAALAPALVEQVFDLVRTLPESAVAVLMVEQRARQALAIADRGYILDQGRVVMGGPSAELLADTRMAELYLGARQ